jgi:hypothetical protein
MNMAVLCAEWIRDILAFIICKRSELKELRLDKFRRDSIELLDGSSTGDRNDPWSKPHNFTIFLMELHVISMAARPID